MSALTEHVIVPALNHLLSNEPWALARLLPYAGRSMLIVSPPLQLLLEISENGEFLPVAPCQSIPDVTITLPGDMVVKMFMGDHTAAFAAARLSGSADFAETIAFVFRNLQWDAEADIAALIGDIPAHRSMAAIQSIIAWNKRSALNLALNIKEYITDESPQVAKREEIATFGISVGTLRDDLARLEKRIARL